jgi:Predicted xylanase/chitin deacetylase
VTCVFRLRAAGGIASLAILLTACDASLSPTADRALGDGVVLPARPTVFGFVDPGRVPGLGIETIFRESPHVHVTYPTLTDEPALGRGLHAWLSRRVRDHLAARESRRGGPGPSEFNVDWRLTVATGGIVGVRLRVGEFSRDGWTNGYRTFWYDRTGHRLHPSADLLGRDALATLADTTRRMLAARRTGIGTDLITPDPDLFTSLNFNRHGDLVVELDHARTGAKDRVAVEIPAAAAAPLLSGLGRRVQAAVRESAAPGIARAAEPPAAGPHATPQASPAPRTESPDCAHRKCVALAFDDGPGPYTAEIVEIMNRHGACGTFFALGIGAAVRPDLVARVREGCGVVGTHTWSHRDLTTLRLSEIADQLTRGRYAIAGATGTADTPAGPATGTGPTLLLPPYGAVGEQVTAAARDLGFTLVRPDVTVRDGEDPAEIVKRVLNEAGRNTIVLLHESRATVAALPRLLTRLARRGYTFVTVADLRG